MERTGTVKRFFHVRFAQPDMIGTIFGNKFPDSRALAVIGVIRTRSSEYDYALVERGKLIGYGSRMAHHAKRNSVVQRHIIEFMPLRSAMEIQRVILAAVCEAHRHAVCVTVLARPDAQKSIFRPFEQFHRPFFVHQPVTAPYFFKPFIHAITKISYLCRENRHYCYVYYKKRFELGICKFGRLSPAVGAADRP